MFSNAQPKDYNEYYDRHRDKIKQYIRIYKIRLLDYCKLRDWKTVNRLSLKIEDLKNELKRK